MPYCTRCGRKIEEGEVCSCSRPAQPRCGAEGARPNTDEFFSNMKTRMGLGTPDSNSNDCYERGKKIVPDCVETNENEIPIRQYNVAVLRTRMQFMRAEGRLQVTNKRVIFRAAGRSLMGRTAQQHEFAIDEIAGVEVRQDHRFSFLNLLGSILLALLITAITAFLMGRLFYDARGAGKFFCTVLSIASVVPFFLLYRKFWLKVTIGAAGLGCVLTLNLLSLGSKLSLFLGVLILIYALTAILLCCFVRNLVLVIKTKAANGAVVIRRKGITRFSGEQEFTGYAEVLPWTDTDKAAKELGAMLDDIQKMGDYGIDKWRDQ